MEPVKGGWLASPPASVTEILKRADRSSPASWAIRFAANLDGVITVLSGMSDLAQMRDNLSHMKDFTCLTKEELSTLSLAQEALRKIPLIPCTTCNYCAKVCPKNIGISGTFAALNCLTLYEDMAAGEASGRMVGIGTRKVRRNGLHQMRPLRTGLPATYFYSKRA